MLLLVDPALASAVGFALSVLATAGILLLAPGWRDALARWLPRWLAEAIAVPAAAQLACTPLVAAISGQVSLVAVAANLLAAPAVGPATVLGLARRHSDAGLAGRRSTSSGRAAGWCVAWIVAVAAARREPADRGGRLGDRAGGAWRLLTAALRGGSPSLAPRLLARRATGLACCVLMVVVVLVRLPDARAGRRPGG